MYASADWCDQAAGALLLAGMWQMPSAAAAIAACEVWCAGMVCWLVCLSATAATDHVFCFFGAQIEKATEGKELPKATAGAAFM